MRSLYDDIITALSSATFSIADVTIREPYDESQKTYPLIVVHEIVNKPTKHATVNGEERTALAYQLDIQTQNCRNRGGNVLSAFRAGRLLVDEVTTLMETEFKLTRRSVRPESVAPDVQQHTWRGDCVLDSYDTTYRL